jgi:glyceraldehyde-3-phosphate dehydrogenase/erythrose-4-phosphate dehydrogenase
LAPASRWALAASPINGRFPGEVSLENDTLTVDGHEVKLLAEKDPANLTREAAVDGVVLQQVNQRLRLGEVVHGDDLDVLGSAPGSEPLGRTGRALVERRHLRQGDRSQ